MTRPVRCRERGGGGSSLEGQLLVELVLRCRPDGTGQHRQHYAPLARVPPGVVTLSLRTDLAGIGAARANLPTIRSDWAYRDHASDG